MVALFILKKERMIFINGIISFLEWLFNSFFEIIDRLTSSTVQLISNVSMNYFEEVGEIINLDFNLTLFSDIPILSTNVFDFLILFFSIFYTIIFIVCVWKIIKKVVVKITGWKRW